MSWLWYNVDLGSVLKGKQVLGVKQQTRGNTHNCIYSGFVCFRDNHTPKFNAVGFEWDRHTNLKSPNIFDTVDFVVSSRCREAKQEAKDVIVWPIVCTSCFGLMLHNVSNKNFSCEVTADLRTDEGCSRYTDGNIGRVRLSTGWQGIC